ncbi:MAG: DUF4160 domain-containing protein [Ignavibacteria bacterium]|nr:DUF4160 domain-containing protein [Ignavibacteria bacterium]
MKICGNKNFNIYIYPDEHPPPHCHVRLNDDTEISVDIPLIEVRYGKTITKAIKVAIEDNIDILCDAWEELNPQRTKKLKPKGKKK